jgi:hypothetical protein
VYNLPGGDGSWIRTSPFVANKWFTDKNAELDCNLAPLVRLLNKWNVAHSKRLRSLTRTRFESTLDQEGGRLAR